MMVGLGMREDEALHARWEWIDWRRRVMVLTKTKNREAREVPIPDWLMEHLAALHPVTPTLGLVIPDHDEKGQPRPHTRMLTTKPIARASTELKLGHLTPHALRRTFATAHFETGTPLSQIQQMLGHQDPETTMRYILQRPKAQAEAQAKVAEAMGFKNSPPLVPRKHVAKTPKTKQTKKKKSA
jgi:integrase/recombinase XerC